MKIKNSILLSLFMMGNCVSAIHSEVRIYRDVKFEAGMKAFQVAWVAMLFAIVDGGISGGNFPVFSFVGTPIFTLRQLRSYWNWNKKKNIPILIFDREGFTYEHQDGPYKGETIKYFWKDIISHWGVAGANGKSICWNYHVRGVKEVVSIHVSALNIPEEMEAQVESLRQGRIAALDCTER